MTFAQKLELRNQNKEKYFHRFGHHYSTYGYFMLNPRKDDELLQQCLDENKPIVQILDAETLSVIKKAAKGEFSEDAQPEF